MKDAVKVIVYDLKGDVLLLTRSQTHPFLSLHPDFPGGDVDHGESVDEAILRETVEETGLRLSSEQASYCGTWDNHYGTQYHIYTARLDTVRPAVNISWEHVEYNWVSVEHLLALPRPNQSDQFYDLMVDYLRTSCDVGVELA